MAPSGGDGQESTEEFGRTLDKHIADPLEPLIARVGELDRRLGQEMRGVRSIEERLRDPDGHRQA